MQAPLDGEHRLVMQQTGEPIVLLKDQLAGEENRVWIVFIDFLAEPDDLDYRIRAKTKIGA